MRALLALVMAALAGACGGEEAGRGGTLRVAAIGAFDPAGPPTALGGPGALITGATQVGLVAIGADGAIAPALARTWGVGGDGLSYLFRLRADARWPDGREVTAGDAVVVLGRALDPALGHPLRPHLSAIAAVERPAPGVVEIRLSRPEPGLLRLLALPALAIIRGGEAPPPLGPFAVADRGARPIELKPNAAWFGAAAGPGAVRVAVVADTGTAIGAFGRGEVDLVTGAATDGLFAALELPDGAAGALRLESTWGIYGYRVGADPALTDARVRLALSLALDREALLARLFNVPAMRPALGALPPTLGRMGLPLAPAWAGAALGERRRVAGELLAAAGFGPGAPLVVEVAVPRGAEHAAIVREVARQWAVLGVVTRARARRPAAHARLLAGGRFMLAADERIAPAPLPGFFLGGGGEVGADAVARAHENLAMVPLFTPARWHLVGARVAGWRDDVAGAHPLAALSVTKGSVGEP